MDIRKAIEILRSSILQPSRSNAPQATSNTEAAPAESNRQSILDQLEQVARRAVLLRRTGLPVPRSHDARSFIGGLPRLPPHLEWPEGGTPEEPCAWTFTAQIDLAEVPLADSPLPRSGTLYFFYYAYGDWVEEDEVRVLYHAGAGNEFPERAPPPNLGKYSQGSWPWLGEDEVIGRIGFKYPIRFVPFNSFDGYTGESWDDTVVRRPTGKELEDLQDDEINARLAHEVGEPVPHLYETIKSVGAAWPFIWGVIEHSARALCHSIDAMFQYGDYDLRDKPAETIAQFRRIREQAATWAQRAASHSLLELCDEPTRQLYSDEWASYEASIKATRVYSCRPDDYRLEALRLVCYMCASTSQPAAALIPESFRRAIEAEARWEPPKRIHIDHINPIHQMLGYGECVQSAPRDHADDIMLLQLHGDIGFDWLSNIGCSLQFWIAPEALAKRDFDAVKVTFECD